MAVLRNELEKKEKIIKELIADKVRSPVGGLNKENVGQDSTSVNPFLFCISILMSLNRNKKRSLSWKQ